MAGGALRLSVRRHRNARNGASASHVLWLLPNQRHHDKDGNRTHGVDALRAYALRPASPNNDVPRPDLILFLGDQVYADLTTEEMQTFIRGRRDITKPPGQELANFEEYAHLYGLAWSDEAIRWLLSTVPTAMIFDDRSPPETGRSRAAMGWRCAKITGR